MRTVSLLCALALAGCGGNVLGGGDGDGLDAAPGEVALAFTSPAAGSTHVRDVLDADGWLAAEVGFAVEVTGAVDAVVLTAGDAELGDATDGALTGLLRSLGPTVVTATALRDGAVVGEATLPLEVVAPEVADCQGWLELYQLDYTVGPVNQGVEDPVTVTLPLNGMAYRYSGNTAPRSTFFMDCQLAVSLAQAAPLLRRRGVVEVADIGVYNYRCIGGGTPPDCPNGISQHAYALAIDIAGFTDEAGAFYSVNDDWIIDPDGEDTCAAPTDPGADTFLHEAICELKAAGVWNIVLTPNYNAAHRDHFHVDLTPGADFLEAGTVGVDGGPDLH
jgi:hypothetical protein